jgi:hypothetical protein
LSSLVEEDVKSGSENDDSGIDPFEKFMKEEFRNSPQDSEKFILSLYFSKRRYYSKAEDEELMKKLEEIIDREEEEEEKALEEKKNEEVVPEVKDNKVAENLDEYLGCYLDKECEFYIKNKEKIENLEFLNDIDEINRSKDKIKFLNSPKI